MNPAKCGQKFHEGENLVPAIITESSISVNFSVPCNYSKCPQPGACLCKRKQIVSQIAIENVKVMQNA